MPTSNGTMYNLLLFSHPFELQNVIEEYESCVVQHDPVLNANNDETDASVSVQLRQHDVYELFINLKSKR